VIYIFLPAYNEEVALPRVVEKFDRVLKKENRPYNIVVLDDGSSDKTAETAENLAKTYPLTLLRHPVNQGLGQTLIDGFEYLAKKSAADELIVTLDCDDTHDPKYLPSALKKAEAGYDVVVLSRYEPGGGEEGLPWPKKITSRGAGFFLKLFFPMKGVRDYSCGYRVYKASALKKAFQVFGNKFIELPHMGFVAMPEVLIKMRMLGCRITESPFILNYGLKPGKSKNRSLRTIAGYFALVKLCWRRPLMSFPRKRESTHSSF